MRYILGLLCLLFVVSTFAAPPSGTITLNPASGVAPYTSTLTWSVSGAASCIAADGWTGSKAASGTQQVTVNAATKYTLTCVAADGQTVTTWTPPATNTDGSALSDLAGFNIYRGTSSTNLTRLKSVGPGVTSSTDTNLAPGGYYYAVTAVNSGSQESTRSQATPYPVAVSGSSTSMSATADVTKIPSAPSGITVTTVVTVQTTVATPSP